MFYKSKNLFGTCFLFLAPVVNHDLPPWPTQAKQRPTHGWNSVKKRERWGLRFGWITAIIVVKYYKNVFKLCVSNTQSIYLRKMMWKKVSVIFKKLFSIVKIRTFFWITDQTNVKLVEPTLVVFQKNCFFIYVS